MWLAAVSDSYVPSDHRYRRSTKISPCPESHPSGSFTCHTAFGRWAERLSTDTINHSWGGVAQENLQASLQAAVTAPAGELRSTPVPMRVVAKKRCCAMVEPPEKGERATLNPNLLTTLNLLFSDQEKVEGPIRGGFAMKHRRQKRVSFDGERVLNNREDPNRYAARGVSLRPLFRSRARSRVRHVRRARKHATCGCDVRFTLEKRTQVGHQTMSAKCQFRTHAARQNKTVIR